MSQVDYMVVGQGLAGTWVARYLLQSGYSIAVIDHSAADRPSASRIASGIMNPVTGKRFVKTWQADTVLPFARQAYQQLEQQLEVAFFAQKPLVWLLQHIQDLNHLQALSAEPDYVPYIETVQAATFDPALQAHLGYAQLRTNCVQMPMFLTAFRQYLERQNALIETPFDHKDLTLLPQGIQWRNISARHLIFCEGAAIRHNPYFDALPFVPAKGEALHIRLVGADFSRIILKNGVFIIHLDGDYYWAGSNYEHQYTTEQPTEAIRQQIAQQISDTLRCPYDIVGHEAAVRPASLNRRPFVGIHPQYPQLSVLNGLGTKGVSLAPYYAAQLVRHLTEGSPIDAAVAIGRFWN